jgi:DNA repair exonuclease SbcCD nuclease subunit
MRRLARPCYLLRGNHDAQSVITRNLPMPANVHEFSARACQTHILPAHAVALHGHSFPNRAVPEDTSAGYPPPRLGMLNIGLLHTSAEDPGEHATYAPCRLVELQAKGYDYWALGHIHARAVLSERRPWIIFPGNLQGRHAKETGPKGCTLVTVEDGEITTVEHRNVDVLRWAALDVDATDADRPTLDSRIAAAVRAALARADGRPLLARLTLTGTTPLHATLLDDAAQLAADCRAHALNAGGQLWIEAVKLRTRAPAQAQTELLAPLAEAFAAGLDDPDLVRSLLADLDTLRRRLPATAQADLPQDEAGLRRLAEDAWQTVVAALSAETPP